MKNVCRNTVFALAIIAIAIPGNALVTTETETINVRGNTIVVRASSKLQGQRVFTLSNMFDNDSTTCWIEGVQNSLAGQWVDITYSEKKRCKGIIIGSGNRKDMLSLEDFGKPAKLSLKLDEKPAVEYALDWDANQEGLSHSDVNMRKTVLWFDSDTAFTSKMFQLKITDVFPGRRYINLALSDFELIDAYDDRFALLNILTARTQNPNDIGNIISCVRFQNDDELQWIKQAFNTLGQQNKAGSQEDSSYIEQLLNIRPDTIADNNEKARYISAFKQLLITSKKIPRYISMGRAMVYMQPVGSIVFKKNLWNIWRSIITQKSSKGLELTVRYVPMFEGVLQK